MKKFLQKLAFNYLKKTGYTLMPPTVTILPKDMQRFHAQHQVTLYELINAPTPDFFIKRIKWDIVNEFANNIIIKGEDTPDGVMYTVDLLYKNF